MLHGENLPWSVSPMTSPSSSEPTPTASVPAQSSTTAPVFGKKLLSEGLFIALLAPLAFVVIFAFEAGKAHIWGIPYKFISVGSSAALAAAASLLLLAYYLLVTIQLGMMILPAPTTPIRTSLLKMGAIALAFGLFLYMGWPANAESVVPVLLTLLAFVVLEFGYPLLFQWKKKGFQNKLKAQEEVERKVLTVWELPAKVGGPKVGLLLYAFAMIVIFAVVFGDAQARNREEHLVLRGMSDPRQGAVVVEQYDDVLVCMPFDSKTGELIKEFYFVKVGELGFATLRPEKLGRLKIKQD